MLGNDSRFELLRALLLDWLGQLLIFYLFLISPDLLGLYALSVSQLEVQWAWLLFCLLLYPLLGWLFGSYTVLRWRHLPFLVLFKRLFITAIVTLMVVAIARWLVNPGEEVWILYRRVQVVWLGLLTAWSLLIRIALRRGLLLSDPPRLFLLSSDDEMPAILKAWNRVAHRHRLEPITSLALEQHLHDGATPLWVALSANLRHDPGLVGLIERLEIQDPRQFQAISVIGLFERQQQRLPPALLADSDISFDELPWASPFSVQAQLKRLADLFVAAALLFLTAPFLGLAALLIWLEDHGPVFYKQQRSGWLGRPFTVFKLRTMGVQPADGPALWTQPGDQRITEVGQWLRRLRLDELPQLLNVLNGEMSLIGPRPERPELEHVLERHIPHYRKRHWMRPGLSGWAQVCAPYASSLEDSDLKVSYDLFYMRHFSTWLDLVILFRTIKTVLKASGR
jgi:lipopolysaccharide/colanic/teichoic acid biosynthesis glycosyltransferase